MVLVHDNRDRPIREVRTVSTDVVYDITYRYDQLGNRVEMIEASTDDRAGRG